MSLQTFGYTVCTAIENNIKIEKEIKFKGN